MKRILLSLVAMLAMVGMSAQDGNVKMYIEAGSSKDLTKIPVALYMTNDVDIQGLQASFSLPEGLGKANFVYDEEEEVYTVLSSDRCTKSHIKNLVEMFTASKPNDLLISITTGTTTAYFKGNEGEIGTFYFDGSSLAEGTYTVKMYGATAFPNAVGRYDAAGYHTPQQAADYKPFETETTFVIKGGIASGIAAVKTNSAAKGIFNVAGQRMNSLQKGINIVDGQKLFVK